MALLGLHDIASPSASKALIRTEILAPEAEQHDVRVAV